MWGSDCEFQCMQQWHPDRWTRTPSLLSEAKRKFQNIQEAYSGRYAFQDLWIFCIILVGEIMLLKCVFCFVLFGAVLSDPKKRTMYDAGLYDPQEEEDEVIMCLWNVFLSFSWRLFLFCLLVCYGSERHVCF
jgi:hypothetical protein